MSSSLAIPLPLLSAAWRWWVGELAALVPAPLRQHLAGSRGRVVLVVIGDRADIVRESAGRRERLGTIDLTAAIAADAVRMLRAAGAENQVALRLPAEAALRTTVALPLAAERSLAQAVAFALERHTPLKRADTYHGFRLVRRDAPGQRLLVHLTVAPRGVVDDALAALRRLGIEASSVEVAGADRTQATSPNLLPERTRRFMPSLSGVALSALTVLALALGAAAVAIPLYRAHVAADALAASVVDAKRQAHESQRLQQEIDSRRKESGFIAARKRSAPAVSDILDALTRLLPDDTWLTGLRVKGKEIEITGLGSSASAVIGLLDRSAEFASPSFRSPVMPDQQTRRERFNIAGQLRQEVGP